MNEIATADMEPEALRYFAAEVAMHASITNDPVASENAELMRALANAKDALTSQRERIALALEDAMWLDGSGAHPYIHGDTAAGIARSVPV